MRFSDALRQIGKPIAYYRDLARPLGGATCSILFSQIFYWQDKTSDPLGVYKTQEELQNETGLTRTELENARKKLRNLGILIETNKRLEHKIYYRLDLEKLDELIESYSCIGEEAKPEIPNAENPSPRMQETRIGEEAKPAFVLDQEITTLDYNTRLHTNKTPLSPKGESADAEDKKSKNQKIDYQAIADAYNNINEEMGEVLPMVVKVNEERKRKIKKFLGELKSPTISCAENYFRRFFADLREFHQGKNDRGWKANFDYAIRPDVVLKVREECL